MLKTSFSDSEKSYLKFLEDNFDVFMKENYPNISFPSKYPLKLVKKALMRTERFGSIGNMFKRSDVFWHEKRLVRMLNFSSSYFQKVLPELDLNYARFYSYSHDDIESFSRFGDVPTPIKNELETKDKILLTSEEELIAEFLGNRIIVEGYDYKKSLFDSITKETLEAKTCLALDKIDGFMESLLEVLLGNEEFVPILENYGE